jgi:hypothetical protein
VGLLALNVWIRERGLSLNRADMRKQYNRDEKDHPAGWINLCIHYISLLSFIIT